MVSRRARRRAVALLGGVWLQAPVPVIVRVGVVFRIPTLDPFLLLGRLLRTFFWFFVASFTQPSFSEFSLPSTGLKNFWDLFWDDTEVGVFKLCRNEESVMAVLPSGVLVDEDDVPNFFNVGCLGVTPGDNDR
jgi:hypothetical protein